MIWKVPRMWEGADVWILGGGPSLPKQFGVPDKLIQSVVNGTSPPSVYSSYMSFLHDKHVIGINVSFMIGKWIDMVFFGDNVFYSMLRERVLSFPGLKVSCYPQQRDAGIIKVILRDTSHPKGISMNSKMVSWNYNSGAAAINIAYHAGAKRVILLGFDMKTNESSQQHWHDLYGRGPVNQRKKTGDLFGRHLSSFPKIAEDARRLGLEIYNLNPDSAIECFPRISLQNFINTMI